MLIYLVTNHVNDKCYVGQTINSLEKRKVGHINTAKNKRSNMYFHKAIRKYGPDNFIWTTIHDNITTIEFLNKLEIFYVGYYNTFENGYNLTLGGGGSIGWIPSEEVKQKMSDSQSGEKNHMYGKHLSEKSKRMMSMAKKGKYNGKDNPMYGKRGKDNPAARAVIINNKHFDTLKESAEFFGLSPNTIRYRILHKTKWLNYHYAKGGAK